MAKCKYCQKDVTWMKEGRKNVPVEGDGGIHKCEQMENMRNSLKKLEPKTLSAEEIAKYEKAMNDNVKEKGTGRKS
ncbi:MAG: hypothetical protein K9K67_05055 [Bacteriovoracaceae bacterium]|nr:hypothetical protein [Bacteriovoracaceae bacterium]